MPRREAMPRAKAAALTALQLDDSLAEAHTSLAFEEMHYEWDWPGSEREFKRALELNPNYATAHQWYALWFMAQGKAEQALDQLSLAEKADPLSIIIKSDTSELLTCAGRYEQAAQAAKRALDLDPNFPLAHYSLAESYAAQQMYPQAITEYQKTLATDNGNMWAGGGIARAYARMGQRADAERLLEETLKACGKPQRLCDRDRLHLHQSGKQGSSVRMAREGLSESRRRLDSPQRIHASYGPSSRRPICRPGATYWLVTQ